MRELLDSGGARPAGFANREGNAFEGERSAKATCRSDSELFAASTWIIFETCFFHVRKKRLPSRNERGRSPLDPLLVLFLFASHIFGSEIGWVCGWILNDRGWEQPSAHVDFM